MACCRCFYTIGGGKADARPAHGPAADQETGCNRQTHRPGPIFAASRDPAREAYEQAEKDIEQDPEFSAGDPTDDLDEGELAQRDNSDEEGFDALERDRGTGDHPSRQSGKGSEK